MQTLNLSPGRLKDLIILPSSKSYANRALILGALQGKQTQILNLPKALDVVHLINCIKEIGLDIRQDESLVEILNSFPTCEKPGKIELHVGEGGTTARFLSAMLLLGSSEYHLKLGGRLKDRPWDEFLNLAKNLGAYCELEGDLLKIKGPIKLPKILEIDCSKTTQFASAFQLLTVVCETQILPVKLNSSQSYWSMTEKMVRDFQESKRYAVPFDWSSASYPLAFGALNQEIFFPQLKFDSYQADAKFLELLKKFECVHINQDGIKITPMTKNIATEIDVSDCLDLVPALCFFLAYVPGKHKLRGIENLVHKESDRLNEIIKLLSIFNKPANTDGKTLEILGSSEKFYQAIDLNLPDDHRIVMTGALFLLHNAGGKLTPVESVNKSFPDFFQMLKIDTLIPNQSHTVEK